MRVPRGSYVQGVPFNGAFGTRGDSLRGQHDLYGAFGTEFGEYSGGGSQGGYYSSGGAAYQAPPGRWSYY